MTTEVSSGADRLQRVPHVSQIVHFYELDCRDGRIKGPHPAVVLTQSDGITAHLQVFPFGTLISREEVDIPWHTDMFGGQPAKFWNFPPKGEHVCLIEVFPRPLPVAQRGAIFASNVVYC